jgi:hypothetical protein
MRNRLRTVRKHGLQCLNVFFADHSRVPLSAGGCSGANGRAFDEARLAISAGTREIVAPVVWSGDEPALSANPKQHSLTGLGAGYLAFRADLLSDNQRTLYRVGPISETCYRFE